MEIEFIGAAQFFYHRIQIHSNRRQATCHLRLATSEEVRTDILRREIRSRVSTHPFAGRAPSCSLRTRLLRTRSDARRCFGPPRPYPVVRPRGPPRPWPVHLLVSPSLAASCLGACAPCRVLSPVGLRGDDWRWFASPAFGRKLFAAFVVASLAMSWVWTIIACRERNNRTTRT